MISPKLSIIIPCYNCVTTLDEAFNSILESNLEEIPFEVILVDDHSTDNTYDLISQLNDKYDFVIIDQNDKNLGGGATRNRCVDLSSGEVIFCLDSDDMIEANSLRKMYHMIMSENLDGVTFEFSEKFAESKENILSKDKFNYCSDIIPVTSLFTNQLHPLLVVFMIKKNSHYRIKGYPEDHGFDTQAYGFRFLLNGLIAKVCNETTYHHRIDLNYNSYYNREQKAGKINLNWQKVLSESIYIFNDSVKDIIVNFDYYQSRINIFTLLTEKGFDVFDYEILESKESLLNKFYSKLESQKHDKYDHYCLTFLENEAEKKLTNLIASLSLGINSESFKLYFLNFLRNELNVNLFLKQKSPPKRSFKRKMTEKIQNMLTKF